MVWAEWRTAEEMPDLISAEVGKKAQDVCMRSERSFGVTNFSLAILDIERQV
jgi:hypothetical protein